MKSLLFFLIILCSCTLHSQDTKNWKRSNDIPRWVQKEFFTRGLDKNYAITYQLYPPYMTGDFNGDRKKDVAFLIQEISTKKSGIAIIHGKKTQVLRYQISIMGAGEKMNGLGDDFKNVSVWSFVKTGVHSWNTMAVNYDAIHLQTKEGKAGLLSWDGRAYQWHPDPKK